MCICTTAFLSIHLLMVCPIFKGKKLPPPTLGQFQEALMALSKVHSHVWKLLRKIHVSQIVQSLALALGTKWKLHCKYSPQSSGQVNKINRTLKETLTKLAIETGGDWVTLLPFALFRACNTPYQLNLTPFKILYGRPPPVCPIFKGKKLPPPTLGQF